MQEYIMKKLQHSKSKEGQDIAKKKKKINEHRDTVKTY